MNAADRLAALRAEAGWDRPLFKYEAAQEDGPGEVLVGPRPWHGVHELISFGEPDMGPKADLIVSLVNAAPAIEELIRAAEALLAENGDFYEVGRRLGTSHGAHLRACLVGLEKVL